MSGSTVSTDATDTSSLVRPDETWTPVCRLDQIEPEGGVTALVAGRAVAVIRTHDDQVHALDNYDPFSRASVLSRGIVGTRTVAEEAVPYVASPMYKQGFDLRTGQCLDDADVRVATYDVRLVPGADGPVVEVGAVQEQVQDQEQERHEG